MKKKKMRLVPKIPPLHTLLYDLSSEQYHATEGTYSSSQFKDINKDEEVFIGKYIHKTIERESIPAFDVGTCFHTGTLEPHKLDKEIAVYTGKARVGERWELFKQKNAGKLMITSKQKEQADGLIVSVQNSPLSMEFVKQGKAEVSLFVEILIYRGHVYAPKYEKMYTVESGWVELSERIPAKALSKGRRIIIKTRADCISENFCMDLKSTTGNARNEDAMREKCKYYDYDLSAAMYLDTFSLEYGPQLAEFVLDSVTGEWLSKFVWVFASKDANNARAHWAHRDTILIGRKKFYLALKKLDQLIRNNFEIVDSMGIIGPHPADLHYLQRDEDLL